MAKDLESIIKEFDYKFKNLLPNDKMKSFITQAFEAGEKKGNETGYTAGEKEGRRREAETWTRQNANQHDTRIRQSLIQEAVNKIEGMKKTAKKVNGMLPLRAEENRNGYNQALDQVINKLKELF